MLGEKVEEKESKSLDKVHKKANSARIALIVISLILVAVGVTFIVLNILKNK